MTLVIREADDIYFSVKNHGILESTTNGALCMAKKFFDLSTETKMEVNKLYRILVRMNPDIVY